MFLQADSSESRRALSTAMVALLGFSWQLIRLPILTLLVVLEPVVTFLLAGLALLGILTTIFFKLTGPSDFPFWTMLTISIGFGIALVPFYSLISLLSR